MRQLTAYASYLDNLGAPLVGRARFFNMDGSPAGVYSLDNATQAYVSIGNSVFTNSSGQLVPQVFLADHDYIVVFDKYIGDGTMAEDNEPESWEEQGSAVDRYNTLGIVLDGDSVRSIDTITDLRDTQAVPMTGGEMVMLLGYNFRGDKPAIFYRWNGNSTKVDNGGSVIKVNDVSVGRWELTECPGHLDVRHFGAFPLEASVADPVQRYAIQQAGNYARSNDCGLYFPASDTAIYYDITSLNLYDVDASPAARVFSKTPEAGDSPDSTKATITGIVQVHCGGDTQGQVELVNDHVRSSWEGDYGYAILSPTEELTVDSTMSAGNRTLNGIRVVFDEMAVGNYSFTDCEIVSNGKFSSSYTYSFTRCRYTDRYWADPTQALEPVLNDCIIDIEDFAELRNWVEAKVTTGDYVLDFVGKYIATLLLDFPHDINVLNASIGTLGIGSEFQGYNVDIKDSSIGAITADELCGAMTLTGCNVTLGLSTGATQLSASDTVFNGNLDNQGVPLNSIQLKGCTVTGYTFAYIVNATGCTFGNGVITHDVEGVNTFYFADNLFQNGATGIGHKIMDSSGGGVINGTWQNNHFDSTVPFLVDGSLMASGHTYTYGGNTGTAPSNTLTKDVTSECAYSSTGVTGLGHVVFTSGTSDFTVFGFGSGTVELELDVVVVDDSPYPGPQEPGATGKWLIPVTLQGMTSIRLDGGGSKGVYYAAIDRGVPFVPKVGSAIAKGTLL